MSGGLCIHEIVLSYILYTMERLTKNFVIILLFLLQITNIIRLENLKIIDFTGPFIQSRLNVYSQHTFRLFQQKNLS